MQMEIYPHDLLYSHYVYKCLATYFINPRIYTDSWRDKMRHCFEKKMGIFLGLNI